MTRPRGTTCPDPVHDWPLPDGYVSAASLADERLTDRGWQNIPCERCGEYGWRPGRINRKTDIRVRASEVAK